MHWQESVDEIWWMLLIARWCTSTWHVCCSLLLISCLQVLRIPNLIPIPFSYALDRFKTEYMGRIWLNQVFITFNWSALATWNKHAWTALLNAHLPNLPCFGDEPGARCCHLALDFPGARWHERWASGQFRNAYLRSLIVHSSQKLWPKLDSGNLAPFKTGGSQNLWKERYLSKNQNVTYSCLEI